MYFRGRIIKKSVLNPWHLIIAYPPPIEQLRVGMRFICATGCGTKLNNTNSLALMKQMRAAGFDIENEDGLPCDTRKEIQSALFDARK